MDEKDQSAQAGPRMALLYGAASLGIGLFFGFSSAVLPLFLSQYTSSSFLIGIVSSLRPGAAVIVQPLVGAWSDRMRSPLGRRRVFLWLGAPLCTAFLVATPLANSLSFVAIEVGLAGLFFSIAYGPYQSLLADLFPSQRRGTVNAVASLMNLVGQATSAGAGAVLGLAATNGIFYLVAFGMLISFGITALGIREPPLTAGAGPSLREQWRSAWSQKPALRFLASQWLLWFGINAVAPFLTLFMVKVYNITETYALLAFLLLVLASGAFALPAGRLGDRLGKKPVLSLGLALFVASSVGVLLVQRYEFAAGLLLLAGAGNAIVNVLSYPLLTELVPAEQVGIFTGLSLGSQSAAVPLAILSAGALIEVFGYPSIFALLAATSIASLGILRGIQSERMV